MQILIYNKRNRCYQSLSLYWKETERKIMDKDPTLGQEEKIK